MSSRSFNRKDFLVLTITSVSAAVIAACGSDPAAPGPVGGAGSGAGGAGTAGSGHAGRGTAGSGQAGSGTAGSGQAGSGTAGSGQAGSGMGGASGGTGGASAGSGGTAGGSAGAAGGGGNSCSANIVATSSGASHTHMLTVLVADITAGTTKKIQTSNSSGHTHWVEITAADFTTLKAGGEVKKKSCSGGDHQYVLKCGGGGTAPALPTATECPDADMCGATEATTCT